MNLNLNLKSLYSRQTIWYLCSMFNADKTNLLVCGSKHGFAKTRNFKHSFLGKQPLQ